MTWINSDSNSEIKSSLACFYTEKQEEPHPNFNNQAWSDSHMPF